MSVSFLDDVIFFLVINVLQQNTLSPRQGNINAQIESQILYLKKTCKHNIYRNSNLEHTLFMLSVQN